MTGLSLVPVTLREANAFVAQHHRHSRPTSGHKFSVAVASANGVCGVAIAGRPVARLLDDGVTLEVLRVCTDGTPNACSMLYAAVKRAGIAMGYAPRRIITYTLASENGASLRASGWVIDAEVKSDSWNRPGRQREEKAPIGPKLRWRAAQ